MTTPYEAATHRADMRDEAPSRQQQEVRALALSAAERRAITRHTLLALLAGGLLLLSLAWPWLSPAGARGDATVAQLLAAAASLVVAPPVFAGAWHSLRSPSLHGVTDRLIALAMLGAWAVGDMTTAALLPIVMTFGHALEERSVLGSQEAIRALGRLTSGKVRRVRESGEIEEVAYEAIRQGDLVDVPPGARIPADGVVRQGRSSIDNGPITGESLPQDASEGASVYGGAINLDGPLRVEITQVGEASTLGKVIELMQRAQAAKPPITQALERYMDVYLALVLLIAAIVWFASANAQAMLAVIVAACPCALVLAAPSTAIAGIAAGARRGILFRNSAFLDKIAEIDSLVIDKTGTLTHGELRLTHTLWQPGVDEAQARELALRLALGSAHPVCRALVREMSSGIEPLAEARELRGLGVIAQTPAGVAVLGRADLLAQHVSALPAAPAATAVMDGPCAGLALDGRLLAWFGFADTLRVEARAALDDLRTLGITREALVTGDRESVARRLAGEVGIETVVAQALPHDKLDYVLAEIDAGHHPLVVGDGLNDVLAIKAGSTSVAMGERGVDIAVACADVVLLADDLRRLPDCIRLGRACRRIATTNAAIGLAWTVAVIALAALGALSAVAAAVLHNVGTLVVIGNAGRLLRRDDAAPHNPSA
ncbi:heavy metal translocating P-type ATPase [Paraburkholderia bannensis]|uniref:P-type Zn(2+) transporter n=1 Tax=Paraburkholderia bannensis TaxID=765414 RepID=A0A7W9U3Q2_9BURK|nr:MULTISPECIES: cation-translocating P-type ATPase [Paraburkholderia]MBB3261412.1 heavy metal translocating P-type ATPase [Paraburkholderia sp. WP4_3_2]MBB6106374.1 heavy metal translocating P-type ATPase [Paraburkholderia bannensis]